MKDDTTMPSDTATASVSSPVLIPERPTLYQCVYPEPLARIGWMTSAPADDREFFDMSQYPPGSVLVTLPGSTPPPAKEPKSNHTPAQPGEECAGCGVCEPAPTPKAEPKPIPWPSDLSTLVGKRITTAALEGRFIGAYKEPLLVTKIWPADHLESPWIEATAADGVEGSISLSHRILLSIEDAEPKPAPPQSEDWRSRCVVKRHHNDISTMPERHCGWIVLRAAERQMLTHTDIYGNPGLTWEYSQYVDLTSVDGKPAIRERWLFPSEAEARAALSKAPPPPDHIGDTNKMEPAPFAPLPHGWVPTGMKPLPNPGPHSNDWVMEREHVWLAEVNRLRRELHDQQKGKSRPSDPPAQQESKP